MDWKKLSIKNFIAELPQDINNNFQVFNDYIDSFYDGNQQMFIKPLTTTGRVKGTTGDFINLIVDNLIIRNHDSSTVTPEIDPDNLQYVETYNGNDSIVRTQLSSNPWETRLSYDIRWLDTTLDQKYYKLNNVTPIAINAQAVGQEIYIMYDRMIDSGDDYKIIMDPNDPITNLQRVLYFEPVMGPITYHTLVCVQTDASFGSVWAVKNWSGAFGSELIDYQVNP